MHLTQRDMLLIKAARVNYYYSIPTQNAIIQKETTGYIAVLDRSHMFASSHVNAIVLGAPCRKTSGVGVGGVAQGGAKEVIPNHPDHAVPPCDAGR